MSHLMSQLFQSAMAILQFSPSSLISSMTFSPRRKIMALSDSGKTQKNLITTDYVSSFSLCPCGRRHFLGLGAMPFLPISPSYASGSSASTSMVSSPDSTFCSFLLFFFVWVETGFTVYWINMSNLISAWCRIKKTSNVRTLGFIWKLMKDASSNHLNHFILGRYEKISSFKARLVWGIFRVVYEYRYGIVRERG